MITDSGSGGIRVTNDVDAIAEVSSYAKYAGFSDRYEVRKELRAVVIAFVSEELMPLRALPIASKTVNDDAERFLASVPDRVTVVLAEREDR